VNKDLPAWCKEVRKAMIDKDMSVQDLASAIGMARQYVSAIINGRLLSDKGKRVICDFLNIAA
jgi:DNA-binding Xre family transcriptional regulator